MTLQLCALHSVHAFVLVPQTRSLETCLLSVELGNHDGLPLNNQVEPCSANVFVQIEVTKQCGPSYTFISYIGMAFGTDEMGLRGTCVAVLLCS